jgi:hypothetical protein
MYLSFKVKDFTYSLTPNKMKKCTLNNRKIIYINNSIGFIILILLMMINPGCRKDSSSKTPTVQSTSPTEKKSTTVNSSVSTLHLGDKYGGGIIFYMDVTGQHGLIADIYDTNYKMLKWGDSYFLNTGATGTAVGTGAANTKKIIAVQGTKYIYAALVCANYRGGGYADWFLPSKDELYLLYKQKMAGVVKNFTWGAYWSSSEFYVATNPQKQAYAWSKTFYNETAFYTLKDRQDGVRAVRAF